MYYVAVKYGVKSVMLYRKIAEAGVVPVLDTQDLTTELIYAKDLSLISDSCMNLITIKDELHILDTPLAFNNNHARVVNDCLELNIKGKIVSFHETAQAGIGIKLRLQYFFRYRDYMVLRFTFLDSDSNMNWVSEAYTVDGKCVCWWTKNMKACTDAKLAAMIDTLSEV